MKMGALDKRARRYLAMQAGLSFLFVVMALGFGWGSAVAARALLLEKEAAAVSSLLACGVPETVVTTAFTDGAAATEAGTAFLAELGHTPATLPLPWQVMAGPAGGAFLTALLLGGLVFASSALFLKRRTALYQSAAETVAAYAAGDLSARLPDGQEGALSQLFAAVNDLARSLAAQGENEARVKDFLKTMVSDISHQLKTPLAALTMYNEIIAAEPQNAEVVARFSEKSARAIDKLSQLIQALLRLVRLDAGSVAFVRQPVMLHTLVDEILEPFETRALKESKQLSCSGDERAVLACDAAWTKEAVANLVKNALDHTAQGGHVDIRWGMSPAFLWLSVADDGPGIAAEDIHHIFKRFYRSVLSSGQSQGVGLGLPIAKAIVEGQGGTLSVTSTPGKGAVFTMTFPRAGNAAGAAGG